MVTRGVQSIQLDVQHVREPGERVPVIEMGRGYGPGDGLAREPGPDLRVLGHVLLVIEGNEVVQTHLLECKQGREGQAQADQRAIAENKSSLEKQLEQTRQLEEEKEREERNLKKEKVRRHKLLQDVRSKKAVYEQAIHEMEESARQIQAIIDHLERQRREAASMALVPPEFKQKAGLFQRSKGSLPWPLRGKVIGKFGKRTHPQYKTVTFNKGIDIDAPYGAEIHAVAAGRAIYIGWLRGYGKFLILDHQLGYYTLYAHTSEILIEEGDIVDTGTVIARVGETGSLEGSKLHFEIRHQKDHLDPRDWLE